MKKTVHIESSLRRYLDLSKCDGFTPGLLLGQSSSDKDFVVHVARTQVQKDSEDTSLKKISDLREEHVIEHTRNVIQNLPGGMTVLGLFFVGDATLLNATALNAVKNILNAIMKFQAENEFYFLDTNSNSKYVLHYVDSANVTCKRFSPTQGGNQFDVTECIFSTHSWLRISCSYDFEHLLPLYMETVSNGILHDKFMEILKYISEGVKESVLLFNNEVRNKSEPLKNVKEESNKQSSENRSDSDSSTPISVDLYTPSVQQISDTSSKISDYMAELKCFGSLCSDVYLHDNAIVDEAVKAIKEDIIRSLCSRLTMHCNSLLEDLSSSGLDEAKIIHEPPRRISVMLPYSKVRFTDYLFPGEDNTCTLPAKEQLDIRDVEDDTRLYELLEIEADASEFYSGDIPSEKDEVDARKNNLSFTISIGVILTLLVVIFAIFYQKIRS